MQASERRARGKRKTGEREGAPPSNRGALGRFFPPREHPRRQQSWRIGEAGPPLASTRRSNLGSIVVVDDDDDEDDDDNHNNNNNNNNHFKPARSYMSA